jgi:hypothetical protein
MTSNQDAKIIISGSGTLNADVVAVGYQAQAQKVINAAGTALAEKGLAEVASKLESLSTALSQQADKLADPQTAFGLAERIAAELSRKKPDKLTLKGAPDGNRRRDEVGRGNRLGGVVVEGPRGCAILINMHRFDEEFPSIARTQTPPRSGGLFPLQGDASMPLIQPGLNVRDALNLLAMRRARRGDGRCRARETPRRRSRQGTPLVRRP